MGLSAQQLSSIIQEISPDLSGGLIRKIDQPTQKSVVFEIEKNRTRHFLFFSAHPQFSRCHLLQKKMETPKTPPNFCQLLRAHLRHKRILSVEQFNDDRIIQLIVRWPNHDRADSIFIAELTGTTSNFFLLDQEKSILGYLKTPGPNRNLIRGGPYIPPPAKKNLNFSETPLQQLNIVSPYPFNRAIDLHFSHLEKEAHQKQERNVLLRQLENAIRQCKTKLGRLQSRYEESKKSIKYQFYGEYLKSRLYEIKPGMTQLLFDKELTGETHSGTVIPLNPALSPTENMTRFFKRYKKGQMALQSLIPMIEKEKTCLIQLEAEKNTVLENPSITRSFVVEDFPNKNSFSKKRKKGPPVFLSSDKLYVFAGRNALENEKITFGLARGNDLWLHARGMSGGHVLIQLAGRKEAPYQTLLDAAHLALHFSPCKKEGRGEVMYTYKKYVKKPKKGKPGSVLCSQEKTLYLEIDRDRLAQILQNRIESEKE